MHAPEPSVPDEPPERRIARLADRVAERLPAQGPISVFVHHNTLHAFVGSPFEEAVVEAARVFGHEPFLREREYREALAVGRIEAADVDHVLRVALAERGQASIGGVVDRQSLWRLALLHGLDPIRGPRLDWVLAETAALARLRADLPAGARASILGAEAASGRTRAGGARVEADAVQALWAACQRAVAAALPWRAPTTPAVAPPPSLLAAVRDATGVDVASRVAPAVVRYVAAFLDQGVAHWSLPTRGEGVRAGFAALHTGAWVRSPTPWLRGLASECAADAAEASDDLRSIERSLRGLGVPEDRYEDVLTEVALLLRGWAGLVRQIETRPDRVPVHAPPASLAGYLAVVLLLVRLAIGDAFGLPQGPALTARLEALHRKAAREEGPAPARAPLPDGAARGEPDRRAANELAWTLFQAAQLLGLSPARVATLAPRSTAALLDELARVGPLVRRRLLHEAYERAHVRTLLDALVDHDARSSAAVAGRPVSQALFCIDDREESIRRHLEEVLPEVETVGVAGFFGVAMYYRGLGDAHARPLCPVAIQPAVEVVEEPVAAARDRHEVERRARRALGLVAAGLGIGSRTAFWGTLLTTVVGALAAVPLVLRVLFPRLMSRIGRRGDRVLSGSIATHLAVAARDVAPSIGTRSGFDVEEMARVVVGVLGDAGVAHRLAPLVLVVGHGSTSLNNPHESAYQCGACGGGRGGPNARAFALMANDPEVRARVATLGVTIPADTVFVGAEHDTADDALRYDDLAHVPASHHARLDALREALDEARRRNAHERARRFDVPRRPLDPRRALAHVEGRAADLAQPRPEYGHATNAYCVVGRRTRTRGLFLDRRAFLVSYDPTLDDAEGATLGRVLGAIIPVVTGISLEYFFGRVDQVGYGSGTKLPHNVTGLLGVMDGHQSDVRTGLVAQMVEIHEPVRLAVVVESSVPRVEAVLARDPGAALLVANGWLHLAVLSPEGPSVHVFEGGRFVPHRRGAASLPAASGSAAWYAGKRGLAGLASVGAPVAGAEGRP